MTRAFNIDCMAAMAQMKDNEFDLAIVDPPYGIGDFNNKPDKRKPHNKIQVVEWNESPPTQEYFDLIRRVAKNHIIFGFQFYIPFLWDELKGVVIHDFGSTGGFGSDADLAITNLQNRVTNFKYRWQGFIRGGDKDTDSNRIHPCEKPVSLYQWLLKNYAKEGDRILDTHLGSGSSRIAAHDMGFDFTGYEIDKDYFDAQELRFNNHIRQQSLFDAKEMY